MKRIILAVAVIFLCGNLLRADEPAPGTPVALLAHEKVQKELKLSADQAKALKGLAAGVKKGDSKLTDAVATAKKELKADQLARLKEISYQVRGGAALADEDVTAELKLTKEQIAKIKGIWADEEKKLKMLLAVARFRNAEAMRTFIANHRKEAAKKMLAELSDDQKKDYTKMQGKAFATEGLDKE
jgi:hypothetical protein